MAGWLSFLVVVLAGIGFGVVVTLVARRFKFGDPEDDASAGIKLTGLYTIFAVILGFVVFSSWQFYLDASDSVRDEAASVAVINRAAQALPSEVGQPISVALERYVLATVTGEWEAGDGGESTGAARRALEDLNRAILAVPADSSASLSNSQSNMFYYLGQLETARGDHVFFSEAEDPEFVWALLALGGLVTIWLSATLHIRSKVTHLQLVGSLSGIIAASLFTVYALSHPFTGPFPVTPAPLQEALQTVTQVVR